MDQVGDVDKEADKGGAGIRGHVDRVDLEEAVVVEEAGGQEGDNSANSQKEYCTQVKANG